MLLSYNNRLIFCWFKGEITEIESVILSSMYEGSVQEKWKEVLAKH